MTGTGCPKIRQILYCRKTLLYRLGSFCFHYYLFLTNYQKHQYLYFFLIFFSYIFTYSPLKCIWIIHLYFSCNCPFFKNYIKNSCFLRKLFHKLFIKSCCKLSCICLQKKVQIIKKTKCCKKSAHFEKKKKLYSK